MSEPLRALVERAAGPVVLAGVLGLSLVLPPATFGALCAVVVAACAIVLVYRWGLRDGERRAARAAAEASQAPALVSRAEAGPPATTPAPALAPPPAPMPPAPAPLLPTEPYPATVDLAELGDPTDVQPIRMRLVLEPAEDRDLHGAVRPERLGCTAVQIGGRWVDLDGVGWDLSALAASAREPGGYYLGNCGCGVPDCAGVWEPVHVRHEGERITWAVRLPYTAPRSSGARTGSQIDPARRLVLAFDAAEYRQQAADLVGTLRAAATDGGPLARLNRHPGELPRQVLQWIDEGGAGWGGREKLPAAS